VVVVGAGLSGLATAYQLQTRLPDASITVLESQHRLGGMIYTESKQGYLLEHGPASFPGHRLGLMKLCQQLHLTAELVSTSSTRLKRYVLHDGVLHLIPGSFGSALLSPMYGMGSAYRLISERFRFASRTTQDESVFQFAERRVGRELGQIIADAVTTEQYAGDARAISIKAGFSLVARAEREYGSVYRGLTKLRLAERNAASKAGIKLADNAATHFSFADGMRRLVEKLNSQLKQPVALGVGVKSIARSAEGNANCWQVSCSDGSTRLADCVILACPVHRQAAIVADLDPELADCLLTIPIAGIISLSLAYAREHVPELSDCQSILLPQRFKRDILKIDFSSSMFPDRAPEGKVLMQVTMGGWFRREMLSWDDDALIMTARRELRNLLHIVKPPNFCQVQRWPRAIPQYTLGHAQRVMQMEKMLKKHPGLYLGGNAYHGVSLHDVATHAERIARQIRDECRAP
jgi:oxygen-dependent protoporphyrinogen oxidase